MTLRKLCTALCLAVLLLWIAPLGSADANNNVTIDIDVTEAKDAKDAKDMKGTKDVKEANDSQNVTDDQVIPKILFTLGSKEALLDGAPYQLEIPPEVVNGSTFLPVRFVVEQVLDAAVKWDAETNSITITKNTTQVVLTLDTGQAYVNEQEVEISSPPFVKEGRTLVPLRFLAENLNMQIEYHPADKTITIMAPDELEEPVVNTPPVITSLGLRQGDVLKMGEVPEFVYTYDNEPADENIVAEEWSSQLVGDNKITSGKPRVFYQPGEHAVTVRIKDAAGQWSEKFTSYVTVSSEKVMSEAKFKFSNPVYGEVFENPENFNFNQLPFNKNVTFKRTGPVLHMSNSPEQVKEPGLLYRSEASGEFRFFYHHLNAAEQKQYLYVIAENNGQYPVTLKTLKSGIGGPAVDYMALGQTVVQRYLASQPAAPITINPGQKIILNTDMRHLNKGEAVTGMLDYQVDGVITMSVVMGPENPPKPEPKPEPEPNPGLDLDTMPGLDETDNPKKDAPKAKEPPAPVVKTPQQLLEEKIDYLLSLPIVPRHPKQVRGVFEQADCLVEIKADGSEKEKITLGKVDPGFDFWTEGVDPLTGDKIDSFGNYGVLYKIKITAPSKTGILLNPRGSIFKGAFQAQDGKVYKAPEGSFFLGLQRATVVGVLEAGQTGQFIYTAPSGSDTPVVWALIPEKHWDD